MGGEFRRAKKYFMRLEPYLNVVCRINRFIVTGVARFAHTSLFSGANNFVDLTSEPLLSRVLGFSEAEIRNVFPTELKRLAAGLSTSVNGAVSELERLYDGYCFDGRSRSFSPFPVLLSLRTGNITQREMDAASGTNWLGLAPRAIIERLALDFSINVAALTTQFDIADLEAQRVHVVPLLLQTGLLSLVQSKPHYCRPPNDYARRSMQAMVATALDIPPAVIAPFAAALRDCDRTAFHKRLWESTTTRVGFSCCTLQCAYCNVPSGSRRTNPSVSKFWHCRDRSDLSWLHVGAGNRRRRQRVRQTSSALPLLGGFSCNPAVLLRNCYCRCSPFSFRSV